MKGSVRESFLAFASSEIKVLDYKRESRVSHKQDTVTYLRKFELPRLTRDPLDFQLQLVNPRREGVVTVEDAKALYTKT